MTQTNPLQQLDDDTRKDLFELRDTREEVLRELGREEGVEEGRRNERIEIAKRMLQEGLAIEKIALFTNLAPSEIQKLQ